MRELKVRDSENVVLVGEELLRKHRARLGAEERAPPLPPCLLPIAAAANTAMSVQAKSAAARRFGGSHPPP